MSHFRAKYTQNYRCPDEVNNLRIRVKLGETQGNFAEAQFRWQEKKFSRFEREFYASEENCITDLEKKYHLDVAKAPETPETNEFDIYSYTNEDEYFLAGESGREDENQAESDSDDDDFGKSVRKCVANPLMSEKWAAMAIMADLGEYVETTWIKKEVVLCTLHYNHQRKILKIYPDFSKGEPYLVGAPRRSFRYFIEDASAKSDKNEDELIQKINAQRQAAKLQQINLPPFHQPLRNQLEISLILEILWAKNFEYDSIYVQYFVDLPPNWRCDDPDQLEGLTQTCKTRGEEGLAHFAHVSEIVLQYNLDQLEKAAIPQCPYVYFQVISKDSWQRYRTEGLTYKNLPIAKPGTYQYHLQCFRLVSPRVSGELRRFFIGDCSNFEDITFVGLPRGHSDAVLSKYGTHTVGTGELALKLHVVHQSHAFVGKKAAGASPNRDIFEKLNSSSLVKSVEQVLQAFQRAKRKMIRARMKIE